MPYTYARIFLYSLAENRHYNKGRVQATPDELRAIFGFITILDEPDALGNYTVQVLKNIPIPRVRPDLYDAFDK